MNNKEHIKSVILALLVLMSVVLTYMVWDFSPDITDVDNTDSKKNDTKPLTKPMTANMDTTIAPFQIINSKDDHPKGTVATVSNVTKLIKPLKNKSAKSVEHVHRDHNLMIPELGQDITILDFTYDLPLSTYLDQVLNSNAKVPNHFNFNRLVIDHNADDRIVLYAISKDRHDYVKVTTTAKFANFKDALATIKSEMKPYTDIITNKDSIDRATHLFAPSKPEKLKTYRMVFNTMSVEKMNAILFDDSTIVRSSKSGVTTYNNNTGVANYNDKDEKYHYKNLSEDEKSSSNMEETIPGTFDFINSHGGFLNEDYRLFSTDNNSGELTYQRFLNGYPTFNNENSNEIQVTWGETGVFDYRRSLLRTDVVLNSEDEKALPKLESVRSKLANNSDIDFEKITNIVVGYEMQDNPDHNHMEVQINSELIPRWYVEYDGKWYIYSDGGLE
ncbi:hypothetical protein J3T65_04220 [Staphylococcus simiae]|uniref:two-component system activity regulator YycH n=1 Tax=Staphylococcus simiae TaxID=308354 RepID=UPI001A96AA15|nr:two-component system activity regulator YycH [Staphylococcus simiae]MBO1198261.1 hypothetical protein [Staphylococcus simiae]MBO1200904.1 hypothetical protein [Staphylococcus simiae]MBO1203135.1 hypothetical protein [Staphylococcus simiae]MBO1210253.1 hypothetical protein [Staphylococcus simiae]MBO1229242.1 hypothetical protein [Staphylococcus simiae]